MSVFNSLSVSVLIVLLVAGLAVGLSVSGTDLVNPNRSLAESEAIRIDAAHQQAVYQLQEQSAQAKTEAEIQTVQRQQKLLDAQYERDIQELQKDSARQDVAFKTWMDFLAFAGRTLSITPLLGIVLWLGPKALTTARTLPVTPKSAQTVIRPVGKTMDPLPEKTPTDPWNSPTYRRQSVKAARQEERNQRKNKINTPIRMYKDPARMSKDEYKKRPLAGD